jgi:GNAT superfamily N-acetyltransferase
MIVENIIKANDIVALLVCASKNDITWKSMFNTFDEYQLFVLSAVYDKNRFITFGVFDESRNVLGYLIMERLRTYNYNELFIHDAFIDEIHRKKGLSQLLFSPVVNAVVSEDIKRLRWCSTQVPEEFWKEKCFGFEVRPVKYYCIDKNEKLINHYKSLSGGGNEDLQ